MCLLSPQRWYRPHILLCRRQLLLLFLLVPLLTRLLLLLVFLQMFSLKE
jgi:hypothetical protein